MKQYKCVQVNHHNEVVPTIEKHQMEGWHLHTYQAAGMNGSVNHYLLFEKE
jgi:hypothetical protein